jgi:hypothetical protein
MRTKYQQEADHERAILQRYEKAGFQTMRSAGSKGWVDGIAWTTIMVIFICSRHSKVKMLDEIWPEQDRINYLKNIVIPTNGCVVFFGKGLNGEKTWTYNNTAKWKLLGIY